MTHAYEIRHHASGEFWIYTPQASTSGEPAFYRFVGPFKTLKEAETGMDRLINQPIWKYDEDGRPVV